MSLVKAPLQIEVVGLPHGAKPIMRQSVDIILKVLNNLSFQGTWELSFLRQHTKKCNIRFQFVRQDPEDSRLVQLRTKCGGKSTCWNIGLRIPNQHDPVKVIDDFKNVHPRTLKVIRREQPAPIAPAKPTVPVVRVEEKVKPQSPTPPQPPIPARTPTKKLVPLLAEGKEYKDWPQTIELAHKSNTAIDIAILGFALVEERRKTKGWSAFLSLNEIPPHIDACAESLWCEILAMEAMDENWHWRDKLAGLTAMEGFQLFNINPDKAVELPPLSPPLFEKPRPTVSPS